MENDERCENCKFFIPISKAQGVCIRYPPVCVVQDNEINTVQPIVDYEDTCGEFKSNSQPDLYLFPSVKDLKFQNE
jgi:hypothetical protein